jgi:flagellar protein FliO/FliZ
MDLFLLFRAVAALAVVLGLVGLAAYAARRWGPAGLLQVRPSTRRRLSIVETLTLDAQRRLVLVRCDAEERLLLLGEGCMLDVHPQAVPDRAGVP